jgi:hypothetical protein
MIQNKYHGICCACGNVVKPFHGFIKRDPGGNGWLFKHQSCVCTKQEVMGTATQPVRRQETAVCGYCDKRKPMKEFDGYVKCFDCREKVRQSRVSAGLPHGGR